MPAWGFKCFDDQAKPDSIKVYHTHVPILLEQI